MKDEKKWFEVLGLIPDTHSKVFDDNYPNGFDHALYHTVGLFAALAVTYYFYGIGFKLAIIIHLIGVVGWVLLELWQGWKGNKAGWYKKKWYRIDKWNRERHQDWMLPALFFVIIPYGIFAKIIL